MAMSESGFDMVACLKRVRQRDEEAARSLLHEIYPLVMKLIRSHLPRRTSEEDLAQMIFMKVFANLDQYSGAVPLEHWVSRIAINTCLNQLRAEKIRPELRWADLSEAEADVLQSMAAAAEDVDAVQNLAARELVEKTFETIDVGGRTMPKIDHQLQRLLKAAAAAPPRVSGAVPFALETRVLV